MKGQSSAAVRYLPSKWDSKGRGQLGDKVNVFVILGMHDSVKTGVLPIQKGREGIPGMRQQGNERARI